MVNRLCKLPKKQSFFLFGARGTGKSTLLQSQLSPDSTFWIDLLNDTLLEKYVLSPQTLADELGALKKLPSTVVIDEVQKAPKLLNTVHQLIEKYKNLQFAMTGSSARRLKQKGVNLLGGRAFVRNLFPLTVSELGDLFHLDNALHWGTLPRLLSLPSQEDKTDFLQAYAHTYIRTEIQEEQWVRKLEPFRRFLPIAAQMNGKPLNYSNVARDVGVDTTTVLNYYVILEETLLGFFLPAYNRSLRKQQRAAAKFYFFDLGIKRALEKRLTQPLLAGTYEYGSAFEHFLVCEIYRLLHYKKKEFEIFYFMSKDGVEVDLILEQPGEKTTLIEIKSAQRVDERDTRHLQAVQKDLRGSQALLLSLDPVPKRLGTVLAFPWRQGIEELGL